MDLRAIDLLKKRTFLPLFLTQFFGAFNDNAFKFAMLTLISYHLSTSQTQSEFYQAIAGALYIIPFFFFSATAGQLADKYNKAFIVKMIKVFELFLMALGGLGFYFGSLFILLTTLTGLGVHSSFFGPIKYAILPDLLPRNRLLAATGLIEASTFLAILLGTLLGTLSIGNVKSGTSYAIILTSMAAMAGFIASLFILRAKSMAADLQVDWNVWRSTKKLLQKVVKNALIGPAIFAISWFWLIGAVMLTKLPDYTNYVLGADSSVFAIFLALFSIGIALGSMTINQWLAGQITLRYVPHAMFLLSLFGFDLYYASPTSADISSLMAWTQFFRSLLHWRIAGDIFFLAFSSGLFVVPLYAYLQVVSNSAMRSRIIAANNIINALFMMTGSIFVMVLLRLHVPISNVFLILAILNTIASIVFWILFPKQRVNIQTSLDNSFD